MVVQDEPQVYDADPTMPISWLLTEVINKNEEVKIVRRRESCVVPRRGGQPTHAAVPMARSWPREQQYLRAASPPGPTASRLAPPQMHRKLRWGFTGLRHPKDQEGEKGCQPR